jgi:FkbM family methyltransferase
MELLGRCWSVADFVLRPPFCRGGVSPRWLSRTHTRLYPEFLREHQIEIELQGKFTCVRVDGEPFLWPATADVEPLKHLLAELLTPDHPHQYDVGLTSLTRGDVVLDIGCCEGGFAALAAARGAEVIAVEPSRTMGELIQRLFEVRGLPQPQIVRCLLDAQPGRAFFQENTRDPAESRITSEPQPGAEVIEVTTIDALTRELPRPPTYLKCDAEGADLRILQGGREFLREHKPKVAITTYHDSTHFAQMRELLHSLGYERVHGKGLIYVAGELRVTMLHAA